MQSKVHLKFEALYQKCLQALTLQGMSECTVDLYSRSLRRAADYFEHFPEGLTPDRLKTYFADLLKTHSWSTVKVDRCGLQFFWKHVLEKDWDWVKIAKPPRVQRLPDILTTEELQTVLKKTEKLRYRVFFFTTYSMGLRLGECLNLRISDIDSKMMRVHIRQAKGNKDRLVDLPTATLNVLREFWKTHQNPVLLFPNQNGTFENIKAVQTPMDRGGVQEALQAALKDCNIHKKISVHSLRHTYGAHLVEANVHLRHIQDLLGHTDPQTTALYTRLSKPAMNDRSKAINTLMSRYEIPLT